MSWVAITAVFVAAMLGAAGWVIKLLIDIKSNLVLIQYQVKELQDHAVEVKKALGVEALKVKKALEQEERNS